MVSWGPRRFSRGKVRAWRQGPCGPPSFNEAAALRLWNARNCSPLRRSSFHLCFIQEPLISRVSVRPSPGFTRASGSYHLGQCHKPYTKPRTRSDQPGGRRFRSGGPSSCASSAAPRGSAGSVPPPLACVGAYRKACDRPPCAAVLLPWEQQARLAAICC